MSRTLRTLHHGRLRGEFEMAIVPFGIDFLDRRGKDIIGSARLGELAVGLQSPRITFKVALVVKLGRVQENGDDRHIVLLNASFYK